MTDKKRRQRGTRTHGGGTHKKNRGAGNRGGRGRAGREKHEHLQYPEKGKSGFKRPEKTQDSIAEISVQELDEDIGLHAATGDAEETDDGYRVDARDVVEDGHDVDVVKVLGSGQVHHALTVVADEFTDTAETRLDAAGGEAVLTEPETETDTGTEPDDDT